MRPGLTVEQLWEWLIEGPVSDAVLAWAPDVAALTSVLLQRSQAFRFVVSPPQPGAWPPPGEQPFAERVQEAAAAWRRAMDAGTGQAPDAVHRSWGSLTEHLHTPVADVVEGRPWELCASALVLHAIADEASAGCAGGGLTTGHGLVFRARAREMLARTGSMARLPRDRVAQLPKSRTTSVGITHRSLSRYSCTTSDGIKVAWNRIPMRRHDRGSMTQHANVLLLPWPLRISERDFVPVAGSVRRPTREPFGFFHYEPSEPVDLELIDRLLDAALDEVDGVDVVVLPEGCLDEPGVEALEALLARRDVTMLVTGLRPRPSAPDRFPLNVLHTSVRLGDRWWRYRQNKHHRWFLDAGQIEAYNIAGSLHPKVRWWEAMEIPERCVHVLELGGGMTVAAVVCEDLARLDGVAELMRSVGPTLVVTLLLDGPQLASRWTARYAGVLADDPGSAVLTLTPLGMATRSRPGGMPPSRVIAMWKDPSRGLREIPIEVGAQGVLLKTVIDSSTRYAADGRQPVDDAIDFYLAGVHQLHAEPRTTGVAAGPVLGTATGVMGPTDLSVLSAWAQAVADAVSVGYEVEAVLAAARPDASWRAGAGLGRPTDRLAAALDALTGVIRSAMEETRTISVTAMKAALEPAPTGETDLESVARATLISALELTRDP
jgi:hypothetical protein